MRNELDARYQGAAETLDIEFFRRGRACRLPCPRPSGTQWGIDFVQERAARCGNRCLFCFIDQLPPGLRRSLYVKDEDLMHSFLNGNYVTLTAARREDLQWLASRGISPLYVSVHATERSVRNCLLGNPRAPGILEQLSFLASRGVGFHTQIVVCPGYNDGPVLTRSIAELLDLGAALRSVAVVPVGLTRWQRNPLRKVTPDEASAICAKVGQLSDRDAHANGLRRVFIADELFIAARKTIPRRSYYAGYPQIENGVGLVRQFLDEWSAAKRALSPGRGMAGSGRRDAVVITSRSAFPYIREVFDQLAALTDSWRFEVRAAENRLFGDSVTVAGLLSARDIVRAARGRGDAVVVPQVIFNYRGSTLDGYSRGRMRRELGVRLVVAGRLLPLALYFGARIRPGMVGSARGMAR